MTDLRLIRAELLKLRRRHGMVALCALLTVGTVLIFFGVLVGLHGLDAGGATRFADATGALTMVAGVIGIIVGATAGGADIEAGVFRDLAATGRSRNALFLARVPGALALVLPLLAAAVALAALLATALAGGHPAPSGRDVLEGFAAVLTAGALLTAISVGLAAVMGSRGMVIGIALTFQLGVSPILAQIEALHDARAALPAVAVARIQGELAGEVAYLTAVLVVLAWATVALATGAWRSRTQEI
jgi:hypothetical protein